MTVKNKANLPIILLIVVVFLVSVYGLYRQAGALRDSRDVLAERRVQLDQANATLDRLRDLAQRADELDEQHAILSGLLPDQPNQDGLMIQLQSVADLADMRLLFIRFEPRTPADGYVEMPFQFALEGRYHQLLEALDHLWALERAVRVVEVRMSPGRATAPEMLILVKATAFFHAR